MLKYVSDKRQPKSGLSKNCTKFRKTVSFVALTRDATRTGRILFLSNSCATFLSRTLVFHISSPRVCETYFQPLWATWWKPYGTVGVPANHPQPRLFQETLRCGMGALGSLIPNLCFWLSWMIGFDSDIVNKIYPKLLRQRKKSVSKLLFCHVLTKLPVFCLLSRSGKHLNTL